jgi:hypothetical protein
MFEEILIITIPTLFLAIVTIVTGIVMLAQIKAEHELDEGLLKILGMVVRRSCRIFRKRESERKEELEVLAQMKTLLAEDIELRKEGRH